MPWLQLLDCKIVSSGHGCGCNFRPNRGRFDHLTSCKWFFVSTAYVSPVRLDGDEASTDCKLGGQWRRGAEHIPVERRDLLATFIDVGRVMSSHSTQRGGSYGWRVMLAMVVMLASVLAVRPSLAETQIQFKTPRIALNQGISALRSGNYAIAIPALEAAALAHEFPARYYLARIYADNNGPYTDHAKAYDLLRKFVSDYVDVDPADYRKAPIVARAFTRVARYIRDGVPETGLDANIDRAVEYFQHSATFFRDEDAQFELAKLRLTGEGLRRSVPAALDWLSRLSQRGHPGAQAFLADLNWRGKYTRRNPVRALALITLALEGAPSEDRVWIEDIHQNIFCGATKGTRQAVVGLVADWRKKYGRSTSAQDQDSLPTLTTSATRTCQNGEPVRRLEPAIIAGESPKTGAPGVRPALQFERGSTTTGPAIRPTGEAKPQ